MLTNMKRNISLDIIRIIATISVVVGHLFQSNVPPILGPFTKHGGFGVALFFLLSGYLVTTSVLQNPRWHSFLVLRSFRILPAYVLALGLYASLKLVSGSPYTIIETVQFLTFTGYIGNIEPTLAGVEWTLRIEVLFYIIAVGWLLLRQCTLHRIAIRRTPLLASLLSLQFVLLIVTPYITADQRPFTIGQCIIVGILLKLTEKSPILQSCAVILTSIIIAELSVRAGREQFDFIPFISIAFIVFVTGKSLPTIVNLTNGHVIQFAANCTYSIYLYHNWVLRKLLTVTQPILAVIVFLVAICITYQLTEKPINRLGRKLIQ